MTTHACSSISFQNGAAPRLSSIKKVGLWPGSGMVKRHPHGPGRATGHLGAHLEPGAFAVERGPREDQKRTNGCAFP